MKLSTPSGLVSAQKRRRALSLHAQLRLRCQDLRLRFRMITLNLGWDGGETLFGTFDEREKNRTSVGLARATDVGELFAIS